MEKPYSGRAVLQESIRDLVIEIPSKKNWFVIIFMVGWLGGWLLGEIAALGFLIGVFVGDEQVFASFFIFFWLIAWTAGGFFAMRAVFWMISGKEIISFRSTELMVQKKGMLLSKPKTYDLNEVKNFSVNANSGIDTIFGNIDRTNPWNTGNQGMFKFDYGLKTIRFGNGIDEAEARFLLEKIRSKKLLRE